MSGTNATISILTIDKNIKTICVNYDGNPSYTGKVLNDVYINTQLVEKLLSHGNISGLHASENLSNNKQKQTYSTKKDYLECVKYYNFNYLFKEEDQSWYLVKGNKFKKLSEVLEDSTEKTQSLTTKRKIK